MSHSTGSNVGNAGFTLIEVLVALSIVGVALSSIGALMASAARGNRSIEAHLTILETARSVMAALPDRDQLRPDNALGAIAHQRWRIDVSPYPVGNSSTQTKGSWIPQSVVVSVRSPTGVEIELRTIRLRQRSSG